MTAQSLAGSGLWVPDFIPINFALENTTFVIDASGERAVVVLRCPKDGVLDRFDALVGAVANSPDNGLRFSFQGVNAADGQNDGTILGATNNAFVTYAHTVTTGWKSTNFGETVTVTRGQLIACVIDIPSFTASDSVTITGINHSVSNYFPYCISATNTKQPSRSLCIALHYTDGYAFISPLFPGCDTVTTVNYNSGTLVADEWGMAFQVPWPCKLSQIGVELGVNAGGGNDFEVLVYDASNTVLSTIAQDGDVFGGTTVARGCQFPLASELTLSPNTTYRITIRPTTVNGILIEYMTFQSLALMNAMGGGSNFYMTSRLDQTGAWTDYNAASPGFRRPRMSLLLNAFDDAVSAGSGSHRFGAGLSGTRR